MDNTEGVLRKAPLFEGLDDEGARALRRQMAEVKLSRGEPQNARDGQATPASTHSSPKRNRIAT